MGVESTEIDDTADVEPAAHDADALDSDDDSENDDIYLDMDDSDGKAVDLPN